MPIRDREHGQILMEREAAREKAREAERAAEAHRRQEEADARARERQRDQLREEARAAIKNEVAISQLTDEQELGVRHVIDMAMQDPPVRICWLRHGTQSGDLVTATNAVSWGRARTITIWPLSTRIRVAVGLHELGHQRDLDDRRRSKIGREVFAWSWARNHALVWDEITDGHLRHCLGTYLASATKADVLDVIAAEEFLREPLARHRKPAQFAVRDFLEADFRRVWGRLDCQGPHCGSRTGTAVCKRGLRALCRRCAGHADVDAQFAEMRAARKTPPARRFAPLPPRRCARCGYLPTDVPRPATEWRASIHPSDQRIENRIPANAEHLVPFCRSCAAKYGHGPTTYPTPLKEK